MRAIPKETGDAPSKGDLSFVDNAIDVNTGTIQLKATFRNEKRSLWPGQFVDVVLGLSSQPNALLVPSEAVQSGQRGTYVYVVKADSTVESRPVSGRPHGGRPRWWWKAGWPPAKRSSPMANCACRRAPRSEVKS